MVSLWMPVIVLLTSRLVSLDIQGIGPRPGIFANTCDLPGYLHSRLPARDLHAVLRNLFGYMQIRGWRTYSCELVTEIAVKRFKPGWKFYRRLSLSIEYYSPVVDILPVWRFNK